MPTPKRPDNGVTKRAVWNDQTELWEQVVI